MVIFYSLFCAVEPLYYENFNLEDIVTPVDVEQLSRLLHETKFDSKKSSFLIEGFSNAFDIGYQGSEVIQQNSHNLKLKNPGTISYCGIK